MKAIAFKAGPVLLLVLATILGGVLVTRGQDQHRNAIRKFMRQKLGLSQRVLEGLALEDYDLIARNGQALRELSEDALWRASPDVNYIRLSTEFQNLADDLVSNARKKNLDGATLAYVDMTMNCVKCHRLVRDKHLLAFHR